MKMNRQKARGQKIIEYVLLVVLLSIVAIAILTVLGRKTRDVLVTVEESMVTANTEVAGAPPTPPQQGGWWEEVMQGAYDRSVAAGLSKDQAKATAIQAFRNHPKYGDLTDEEKQAATEYFKNL